MWRILAISSQPSAYERLYDCPSTCPAQCAARTALRLSPQKLSCDDYDSLTQENPTPPVLGESARNPTVYILYIYWARRAGLVAIPIIPNPNYPTQSKNDLLINGVIY